MCASGQSSENQLQEEEEEVLERLRDAERKLGGEYGRNSGDWFVGFVQLHRRRVNHLGGWWDHHLEELRLRNRFTSAANPKISQRCESVLSIVEVTQLNILFGLRLIFIHGFHDQFVRWLPEIVC